MPYQHDRFYLRSSLGVGGGQLRGNWGAEGQIPGDSGSALVRARGLMGAAEILVGGTPRRGWAVGGGLRFHSAPNPTGRIAGYDLNEVPNPHLRIYEAGAFVDYYPHPKAGWHMLGFGGLAAATVGSSEFRYHSVASGLALGIGTGYDFWVAPEWSLGPILSLQGAVVSGSATQWGTLLTGSFGLSVTFH